MGRARAPLVVRRVHDRSGVLTQARVPHVGDHADDLRPRRRRGAALDPAADRIAVRPVAPGERLQVHVAPSADGATREAAVTQGGEAGIEEVPAILCDDWTDAQIKAFRLLVNRSVSWAAWDTDLLKLELADLEAAFRGPIADELRALGPSLVAA